MFRFTIDKTMEIFDRKYYIGFFPLLFPFNLRSLYLIPIRGVIPMNSNSSRFELGKLMIFIGKEIVNELLDLKRVILMSFWGLKPTFPLKFYMFICIQ